MQAEQGLQSSRLQIVGQQVPHMPKVKLCLLFESAYGYSCLVLFDYAGIRANLNALPNWVFLQKSPF